MLAGERKLEKMEYKPPLSGSVGIVVGGLLAMAMQR